MSKRHDKLGIKQTIQKHWMDYVVKMMLAGLKEKEIRVELDEFLATQKQSGGTGQRGKKHMAWLSVFSHRGLHQIKI